MTIPNYAVIGGATLHHGDVLEVLQADVNGYPFALGYGERLIPDESIDAVVTDPPYGIAFMGKAWDQPGEFGSPRKSIHGTTTDSAAMEAGRYDLSPTAMRNFQRWVEAWSTECLRVLKPGGHLVAFGGARTWHRLTCGIEDAGFEIRDSIAWLNVQGFPKNHDVAAAIDKLDAAAERKRRAYDFQEWLRAYLTPAQVDEITGTKMGHHLTTHPTQPTVATPEMLDALRPHVPEVPEHIERIVVDRVVESKNYAAREITGQHEKPAPAQEWMRRLGEAAASEAKEIRGRAHTEEAQKWEGWGTALKPAFEPIAVAQKPFRTTIAANVVAHGVGALNIDGCRIPRAEGDRLEYGLDREIPSSPSVALGEFAVTSPYDPHPGGRWPTNVVIDSETAAELGPEIAKMFPVFVFHPKASTAQLPRVGEVQHPTVKPVGLMAWLARLVTPAGGRILETFAGSGTTGEAALSEGFEIVMIERESEYLPLIEKRMRRDLPVSLFGGMFDDEIAS